MSVQASLSRASPRLPFPALRPAPCPAVPTPPLLLAAQGPPSCLPPAWALHFSSFSPFHPYWVPGPEIQGTKVDLHLAPVGRPWRRSSPANPPNWTSPLGNSHLLNSGLTWKALGFTLLPSSSFHPGLDGNPESPRGPRKSVLAALAIGEG